MSPTTTKKIGHGTFEERGIRPIQPVTSPPKTSTVARLAERLEKEYDHTPEAARTIAEAVEDPRVAREQLGRLSRVPVRGGTLYTLDVRVNALRVLIDPVNPRTVGSIDYPAAASADARSKYWAPRDLSVDEDTPGELVFEASTQEALADALDDAKGVLRGQNALDESIALNGVFFPLTIMPWRIAFDDGSEIAALVARDGSSRLNGAQENLGIGPSDPILGAIADPRRSRAVVGEIASIGERAQEEISSPDAARAHSVMVPARVIVSYEPDPGSDTDLLDVVDEFVALLHLDPPTPWTPPAESHKRADIVIEALKREALLSPARAEYFAGMMDQKTAGEKNLAMYPDERAAIILHFFVKGPSSKVREAIARGIRQLTGKGQARKEYKTPIIASLVLRGAHWTSPNRRKSAESTLPRAYMMSALWEHEWRPTKRTNDEILEVVLNNLDEGKPFSPSILELAVRGSYWLVVHGALGRESFGQSGDEEKDNRPPAAVLAELCRTGHGLRVLHRAIKDGRAGRPPRRIDEKGDLQTSGSGKVEAMDNAWLRTTFRTQTKKGSSGARTNRISPQEELASEVRGIREDVADLAARVDGLRSILGDDEMPIVNEVGIPMATLQSIEEEFRFGVMGPLWPYGGIHQSRGHANSGAPGEDAYEAAVMAES
ncbi:MAG TPA: hypothetical protein VNY27_10970 [Solirubrobacteraceae bacterium]|jgi:hypothetical protein|nr:hypothetical protein [Solirubrobacteraceae bacterium]